MSEPSRAKHPATVRWDRIRPDGSIKPFSLEEQWQQVADWHAFAVDDQSEEYPSLDGLNQAWSEVESVQTYGGKPIVERGEELRRVSCSPLSTLFYMVEMGFYPPPELLLTLLDCWDSYSGSGGRMTLEEAFLGRAVQKSGNYAKRSSTRFAKFMRHMEFHKLTREGSTPQEAAESISEMFGGRIEPESILREIRGPGRRKPKAEK